MRIGFRWTNTGNHPTEDYIDLFDEDIFANDSTDLPIEHDVLRPNGRFYGRARCLMTIRNTKVQMDYTAFRNDNTSRGMALGILRFEYNQATNPPIFNVAWCNDGDNIFHEWEEVEIIRRRSRMQTQAELDGIFNDIVADAVRLSREELEILLPPIGYIPPQRITTTTAYIRNPYVVAFALCRANGVCESCGNEAPFINQNGQPYLEVHHITPLSEGGADDADNTQAICPNCHRELHFGIVA